MSIRSLLIQALAFSLFGTNGIAYAQTISQAKDFIVAGECEEATEILHQIIAAKPKDSEAPYQLGLAMLCSGNVQHARNAFLDAKKKGSIEADYQLAELALKNYEVDEAATHINNYRTALKKVRKGAVDISGDFNDRLDRIKEMLDRVEKVVIIDSLEVDVENFFRYYNLAKVSGQFSDPPVNVKKFLNAEPTVMFETADKRERFWSTENTDHNFELVSSSALYGDQWTDPVSIGSHLNEGGDANYPFLMPDGVTMYFANDGENSIGGYDIFITRRDGEEFLQPTNIGFPYNSPADDYLLAIDETTGIGWWATNRNSHPDSVTIYTFLPSEMRINYDVDDPNLASLARIDSYKQTWAGKDYTQQAQTSKTSAARDSHKANDGFSLSIPGRGVYKSFNEFRSGRARNMMQQYISAQKQFEAFEQQLESMRRNYHAVSNRDAVQKILTAEKELENRRINLKNIRNEIIEAELSH